MGWEARRLGISRGKRSESTVTEQNSVPTKLTAHLYSLNLEEVELDWSLATEHAHKHLDLAALFIHFAHLPFEVLERTIDNNDSIVRCEIYLVLHGVYRHTLHERVVLTLGERYRLGAAADEAGHARRVAHDVPRLIVHDHLYEHVSRIDAFFFGHALAAFDTDLLLGRYNHVKYLVLHTERLDALTQVACYRVLVARVGVDGVPATLTVCLLLCHGD